MRKSEKGFTVVEAVLIVAILAMLGFVGWYAWHNKHKISYTSPSTTQKTKTTTTTSTSSQVWQATAYAVPASVSGSVMTNYGDAALLNYGNGTFRMYFQSFTSSKTNANNPTSSGQVMSAYSTDGVSWKIDSGVRLPNCVPYKQTLFKQSDGSYWFFGTCGLWDTKDGLTFTKVSSTVVVPNVSGNLAFGPVSMVKLTGGQYRAYRSFDFNSQPPNSDAKLYSFTSTDGINFTEESGTRLDTCVTVGGQSYQMRDAEAVEQTTNNMWVMYMATQGACHSSPTQPAPAQSTNTVQPVVVTLTSTDGLTWQGSQVTQVNGGEPYFTLTAGTHQIMIFGRCYSPGQPTPGGALPAIYSQYTGCSLMEAQYKS